MPDARYLRAIVNSDHDRNNNFLFLQTTLNQYDYFEPIKPLILFLRKSTLFLHRIVCQKMSDISTNHPLIFAGKPPTYNQIGRSERARHLLLLGGCGLSMFDINIYGP